MNGLKSIKRNMKNDKTIKNLQFYNKTYYRPGRPAGTTWDQNKTIRLLQEKMRKRCNL